MSASDWVDGPLWVEAGPEQPGSLDPLGFQVEADRIADQLLPGVTVFTTRARYLSFLCWAFLEGLEPPETDRWEVALAVGERLRHEGNHDECAYMGKRILNRRSLKPSDVPPRRLHIQTARVLYSGLLHSCGLADEQGGLSDRGLALARWFGRDACRRLPNVVWACRRLPCLSDIKRTERDHLYGALLKDTADAKNRLRTYREVGRQAWRKLVVEGDPSVMLRQYLRPHSGTEAGRLLHEAAKLELVARSTSALFLRLYRNPSAPLKRVGANRRFIPYQFREDGPELLGDVQSHLRRAETLGGCMGLDGQTPPIRIEALKRWLVDRHRAAKPEGTWIDERWRVVRPGLGPRRIAQGHAFRLVAFGRLLRDVGAA